jgi:hypothetical protein
MNASQPPRLATWLLNRLASPGNRESLIGDLVEQYQQRRSSVWYWRQVLLALVVGCVQDVRDHRLLAARALAIGWLLYGLFSFPVTWLSGVIRFRLEDWLAYTGHYSFWGVFWSGQLPGHVLVYIGCAMSGWIVARLHPARSAAMVCLYSLSVLIVEYGFVSWMFMRHGHPPTPSAALIIPAVLLIGRPLSILVGGLWSVPTHDSSRLIRHVRP